MAATAKPDIGDLTPGSAVLIHFSDSDIFEPALFLGGNGQGVDRRARFLAVHVEADPEPVPYTYEVHRHDGHWAYSETEEQVTVSQCYWPEASTT